MTDDIKQRFNQMSDCLDDLRKILDYTSYASRLNRMQAIRDRINFPIPESLPVEREKTGDPLWDNMKTNKDLPVAEWSDLGKPFKPAPPAPAEAEKLRELAYLWPDGSLIHQAADTIDRLAAALEAADELAEIADEYISWVGDLTLRRDTKKEYDAALTRYREARGEHGRT